MLKMSNSDEIERKRRLVAAAGGWKDVDTDKMIKEIYEGRKTGTSWISVSINGKLGVVFNPQTLFLIRAPFLSWLPRFSWRL